MCHFFVAYVAVYYLVVTVSEVLAFQCAIIIVILILLLHGGK